MALITVYRSEIVERTVAIDLREALDGTEPPKRHHAEDYAVNTSVKDVIRLTHKVEPVVVTVELSHRERGAWRPSIFDDVLDLVLCSSCSDVLLRSEGITCGACEARQALEAIRLHREMHAAC